MSKRPADSNFLIRFFFIHCFLHVYHILTTKQTTSCFTPSRFQLFSKIKKKYSNGKNILFNNLVYTFKGHIFSGAMTTIIFVSFNLLVPTLIRMLLHFMHQNHSEKKQVQEASQFIKILIGVQLVRVICGQHTRRKFHELAIKIQGTLARQLVVKSLNLTRKARRDIPHSQILQLENVDLKLVYNMFNNFYFLFEAPLTIILALIILFVQSPAYGFIGGYWFLIAFLLHRQLDQNMTHCNQTKLGLIEKRSKINYQILDEIRQAKIIGWEDVIIQKNNDLFQEQNHDHYLFYFYNSLYDIILLMLPVLVVVTITVWDYGEPKPITVQQVYMMLSLLGVCYVPMKEFRTISISFHDGLRSLNRIQQYLHMPDLQKSKIISHNIAPGNLIIAQGTAAHHPGDIFDYIFQFQKHVELKPGDRAVILGRRGHGKSSFLQIICGMMHDIKGNIQINGKLAYLPDDFFFMKSRVRDNIAFYNDNVSQEQIEYVAKELGLIQQLKKIGGLDGIMQDINLYTRSQLQRIAIARVLCSKAQIYLLDTPFEQLDRQYEDIVEILLREKQQKQKVLVISTFNHLDFLEPSDKVIIVKEGKVKQFGQYSELILNKKSQITKFFKSKQSKQEFQKNSEEIKSLSLRTGHKIRKILNKMRSNQFVELGFNNSPNSPRVSHEVASPMKRALQRILENRIKQIHQKKQAQKKIILQKFINRFIFSAPIQQILFIMLIIACAQLLHVFIHFYIGHLEEQHGGNNYLNFQNMVVIQVVLTFCLAGILYYEGDVSSQIAIIQGNNLYKQSLESLAKKRIYWFTKQYFVRIADRLNHDYQQIFIACHSLLGIYKNFIILITTVFFISSNGIMAGFIFAIISILYITIFMIFRKVQRLVVKHYYDYKYSFVKTFEGSLEGAEYFHVFGKKDFIIKRAQYKYRRLAGYKLAQKYTNYALSIVCDLTSNFLLSAVISYGLDAKIHNSRFNIALIATSIHLLLNGSEVLKSIVKDTISFQTFFLINIIPFQQINRQKYEQLPKKFIKFQKDQRPLGYEIKFDRVILKEPGDVSADVKFSLTIPQGQVIAIMESMDAFRNLFLYSLTQNIGMISDPQYYDSVGRILIGNTDIRKIDLEYRRQLISVIMKRNFYLSGTLRQNLVRKISIDSKKVEHYVRLLKMDQDLEDFDELGLDSPVYFQNSKVNYQLTKKFAIIRALIYQSKIIIIKDTPLYLDSVSIINLLKQNIPDCTIIILTNKIQSVIGAQRIVNTENYVIVEDGTPAELMEQQNSQIGHLLRDTNIQGYLYMNKVSRTPVKRKKNANKLKKRQTIGSAMQLLFGK